MPRVPKNYKPYYELRMCFRERQKFIEVVEERMRNRKINGKVVPMKKTELAKELGVSEQSIYNFFSTHDKPRRFLAASIANYFRIKRGDWIYNEYPKDNFKVGKRNSQYNHRPKDTREHSESIDGNENEQGRNGGLYGAVTTDVSETNDQP